MPAGRDESFSRKHRLNSSSDFKRIFSRGKRTATPYFVIYCLPNHLEFSRLGIQVKAKIGTAVRRNYLKRITREAFRRMKLDFREPLDLIFIAEKAMNDLDYDQFLGEFAKALRRYLR
jgi:ribonuclease P protein component